MIEVEHLSKVYASTTAIEDIHFSVAPGEIMGFLGPNGAGKTTTMRILSGYLPATKGTARIAGFDVHEQSMEVRRCIGYLPENPPLYLDMTVEGFLFFVARIKGVAAGERKNKVNMAIKRCQLTDKRKTLIRKLSKGYRQRVGIAQAIVHDPPVIILDEPTVGLDPRQIMEVRQLIKNLAGRHTIILSTHILPEVSMTCDRVTIINQGKIVTTNTPTNLMEQLTDSTGYEIEMEGDPIIIKPLLEKIPGVLAVDIYPKLENFQQRCLLKITTNKQMEPGRHLAAIIINKGMYLHEMRRTRPTLEDVFLQLTTEELAERDRSENLNYSF